jgi:hypothetical protein
MKRLIRRRTTNEFLKADGTWTQDVSEAREFPNILAASKTQQERCLINIELVLVVGDNPSERDLVLPLPPSDKEPPFKTPNF